MYNNVHGQFQGLLNEIHAKSPEYKNTTKITIFCQFDNCLSMGHIYLDFNDSGPKTMKAIDLF